MGNYKLKITHQQKKVMFEFLRSKPDLVRGKFTKKFKWENAEKQWKEMTVLLNNTTGPKKDWKSWRKTWHDLRCRSKLKARQRVLMNNYYDETAEDDEILRLITPEAMLRNEEDVFVDFVEVTNQEEDYKVELLKNKPNIELINIPSSSTDKSTSRGNVRSSRIPDEISHLEVENLYIEEPKMSSRNSRKFKSTPEGLAYYEKYLSKKLALKEKYQLEKMKLRKRKIDNEERKIAVMEKIALAIERIT